MLKIEPVGVLLVEDSEITRAGLNLVLSTSEHVRVIGEAADGEAALSKVLELKPQVVLMDIAMPVMDGIAATAQIKREFPDVRVIMLSSHQTDADIFSALEAGADGYCLKDVPVDQLVIAIRTVAAGATWLDSRIGTRVLGHLRQPDGQPKQPVVSGGKSEKLSLREHEVLKALVDGLTNREIAERLIVSIETVRSHMKRILDKLDVEDRTQAAVYAIRERLI